MSGKNKRPAHAETSTTTAQLTTPAVTTLRGEVIAAHGRHYVVAIPNQTQLLTCSTRGKKSDVAVGDWVIVQQSSADQGVIDRIEERAALIYRSDQFKSKLLAANVTQLMMVVATEPFFSEDLLGRALIAGEVENLKIVIVLNKTDLTEFLPATQARLAGYAAMGYQIIPISTYAEPDAARSQLQAVLQGQRTLLVGQSGMGKSSIVNLVMPEAQARIGEISIALGAGRHTTTFTRMYRLDDDTTMVDSPGFQEFGLYHVSEGQLERALPDFTPHLGHCRFYNCRHLQEPGCGILSAFNNKQILPQRHALYAQILREIERPEGR